MKHFFTLFLVLNSFCVLNAQGTNLNKLKILKSGTVITYQVYALHKEQGWSGIRIKEGESIGDSLVITLVSTSKGLQPMDYDDKGKPYYGTTINLEQYSKASTYANFIDAVINIENATTIFLSDELFGKFNITVYPEWEKDFFEFKKDHKVVPFSFKFNNELIKSTINYYKTNKENDTMVTTLAFLNDKDFPIQTHMYLEFNGKDRYGLLFKLSEIKTIDE